MIKIADDQLQRMKFIDDLFNLFETFGEQDGHGLTMVMNGKYGSGKSTVLGFIAEENEKEKKFNIVEYNAWENNLFEKPLIPILYSISKLDNAKSKIKEKALQVLKNIPKAILSTLANAHSVDLQPLCVNENIFEEYNQFRESLKKFKEVLENYCKEKKTILLVDELDRCLPEYQIRALECLYHFLDIPNLIIVIALDKEQLECAIKNKFGENQNVCGYLAKFIQYEIDLPEGDKFGHLKTLMNFRVGTNILIVKTMIANMFKIVDLSLRECEYIVKEINMICNEKNSSGEQMVCADWDPILVAFLLLLKKLDHTLFIKYFGREEDLIKINRSKMVRFVDSRFGRFLEESKHSIVNKLIAALSMRFKLYIINAFQPLETINRNEMAEYLYTEVDKIEQAIDDVIYDMDISNTIKKVQILR